MVLPTSTVQPSLKACDSRQVSLASLDDSELDLHLLDALPILLHAVAQVDGAEHGCDHQACAQVTNPRYHGCVPTTRGEFASISLTPKQSIYPSIYRWLSPRLVDAPGELASPPPHHHSLYIALEMPCHRRHHSLRRRRRCRHMLLLLYKMHKSFVVSRIEHRVDVVDSDDKWSNPFIHSFIHEYMAAIYELTIIYQPWWITTKSKAEHATYHACTLTHAHTRYTAWNIK